MTELDAVLVDLFMRGRKSMQDEIETKAKKIQLPILSQIKDAQAAILSKLESIEQGARIDEATLFNRYFDDNQAFKGFAQDRLRQLRREL